MNHRPTRRGCSFHRRVGFQADCSECRKIMAREEQAVADNKERQAKVNEVIKGSIEEQDSSPWVTWFGFAIAVGALALGIAGSCSDQEGQINVQKMVPKKPVHGVPALPLHH